MNYISLGKSDINISPMGIGTWQASSEWNRNDNEILDAIVESNKLGLNLIDTAEEYGHGRSEKVVGEAIRILGRDNVVVATKVNPPHLRHHDVLKACDASLTRLGIEYIDLYQVHWLDPWGQVPLRDTMKAMDKLTDDGKVRAIGVCNFAVRDLEEARSLLSKTDIVSNQMRYNLLQREIEEEIAPYCKKNNITILAWSPLAQGLLSGKYGSNNDAKRNNPLFSDHNVSEIARFNQVLSSVAARNGRTISQVALNWLMRDKLTVPIPGASDKRQAAENAGAIGWQLTTDNLHEIETAYASLRIEYFP